jgi:glutathione synthase/RimK-type ligase-like ATP-grasp enzyme
MVLRISGIRRKSEFSPNHVGNDLQIINLTARALRDAGAEVTLYDEESITPEFISEEVIFSMVQGPDGTRLLKQIAQRGPLIINSPQSVENCYRVNMVRLLPEHGIPFPRSEVIATDSFFTTMPSGFSPRKVWIKRGDVHAVHKEDVTVAYTNDERVAIIHEFGRRGIGNVVLQEHIDGDTVKFYAIRESEFFHWYYLNGVHHTLFEEGRLHELVQACAEILGLHVMGGDAIISADGAITIIDINDWPSFAPVRNEASRHIAQLLLRKATEYVGEQQHQN